MSNTLDARSFAEYQWPLEFVSLSSLQDFDRFAAGYGPRFAATQALEAAIVQQGGGTLLHALEPLTDVERVYQIASTGKGAPINFRETVVDQDTGLTARHRSVLLLWRHLVQTQGAQARHCYVTEQLTGFYHYLSRHFDVVTGSEYLGPQHAPGALVGGIRHEDLTRLSLPQASVDLLVSLDVLEHVPAYQAALREMARVMRPGGVALLTAPFGPHLDAHLVRAEMRADGSIHHLLEPEYHGDPARPTEGILCYRYFGWQICADLRAAGFADAGVVPIWSLRYGVLGGHNVFWARKV